MGAQRIKTCLIVLVIMVAFAYYWYSSTASESGDDEGDTKVGGGKDINTSEEDINSIIDNIHRQQV